MKTTWIKKIGLALMGMLVLGFASATEPVIKIAGEKKVMVKMNYVSENTMLIIKEVVGSEVYSELIERSTKNYSKTFNLSDFPDGEYAIEIEGSLKVVSFLLNVVNNKIALNDIVKTETFKPVLREKGDKVYVSKYNPENSYMDVTVFNTKNEVVYNETLRGKRNLERVYDFSKVSGEYKIALSNGNRTYTQIVSVDK